MADDEIFTIREVASLVMIVEKIAYTMALYGELPSFKVRGQWRFRRGDIDRWIARQVMRGVTIEPESGPPAFIGKEAMGNER